MGGYAGMILAPARARLGRSGIPPDGGFACEMRRSASSRGTSIVSLSDRGATGSARITAVRQPSTAPSAAVGPLCDDGALLVRCFGKFLVAIMIMRSLLYRQFKQGLMTQKAV